MLHAISIATPEGVRLRTTRRTNMGKEVVYLFKKEKDAAGEKQVMQVEATGRLSEDSLETK